MADIDLKPTAEMAANATRGLELREKHGKGGTAVGVARARDIKNRANLSPDTVKRMHSFFSRHEGNQAGGEDDAGYIAWMLWGGDAGKSWAKRNVEQIDGKSESMKSDNNRPGAKAKFVNREDYNFLFPNQKTKEFIRQFFKRYGDVINGILDIGGFGEITADMPPRVIDAATRKAIRICADNPSDGRRYLPALRAAMKELSDRGLDGSIPDHLRDSRPGAKVKAANNQVYWEPFHEEMYEYTHGKKPRGSGSWIFIAPDKSLVRVPGMMTYSEAKRWLKQNAPMSGHYKVATQRPGSAAKFGQVGEMLSQIESQSHDQRDLAKSNLRKLAAKIADIDHTREEWERYVRVAKSLGYSESQIAGFSRPGAKASFAIPPDSYIRKSDYIKQLLNEIARAFKQKNHEDLKEASHDLLGFAKQLREEAWRDAADMKNNPQDWSRPGAKSKFEKSDDYAAILMKPVTVANCGRMMKVAEEAMKYAKSVGDDDLFELAEEVGHECQATKSRASRKEA